MRIGKIRENTNENSTSLNKYLSQTGICSRREADSWIEQGRVFLNGKVARKGNRVFEGDEVKVDGKIITEKKKEPIYIAYHKPPGIVCTTDRQEPKNIIDAIQFPERIFPIGRLDKPSQGLIFLTNDGDMVNKVLRAKNQHEKVYLVRVTKKITDAFIRGMSNGVPILGTKTLRCEVVKIDDFSFKIILKQGLNRQIRRMCEYFDYGVSHLKRVRIMHISLNDLKKGQWRLLSKSEVLELHQRTQDSIK